MWCLDSWIRDELSPVLGPVAVGPDYGAQS